MDATGHGDDDTRDWRGEAGRWRGEADGLAGENSVLRARVAELEGQVGALAAKVVTLSRLLFGPSSERKKPARSAAGAGGDGRGGGDDGAGGDGGGGGDDGGDGGGGRRRGRRGQRRGGRGHGRRDYSGLDTEEVVLDLPAAARVCPVCGAAYVPFGEECCEQVDWRVRIVRVVYRRPTYRRGCRCAPRGVLAAPPVAKAIGKGRLSAGFLARLLVEKFVLGRPTHRILAALAADGLDMAAGTLVGVFAALSKLLAPLADAIGARNAAAAHLHVDETGWRVFETVAGKDGHRWWCWVFVGPDTTVFRIAPSRSLAVLTEHLGIEVDDAGRLPERLPGGRVLLLSSDFYVVYQSLGAVDGVESLWCWAHIRRYFIRAAEAHPTLRAWARDWLERIGALYVAHATMAATSPGSDAHAWAAAQFSAALNGIDTERRAQAELAGQHPAAAKVLATLDREWDGLARHKQFPQPGLDNNTAERALRGPVVGRKNYYGSGSVAAAELASRTWTITATAERAGYNPLAYLTDYLDACAAADAKPPQDAELARFLPWQGGPADQTAWRRPPAGRRDTPTPDTTHPDTAAPTDTAGPAP